MPEGRRRFIEAGEHVMQGEVMFAIRRFRSVVAVSVPASGTVVSVRVSPGDFVEFGQSLATLCI